MGFRPLSKQLYAQQEEKTRFDAGFTVLRLDIYIYITQGLDAVITWPINIRKRLNRTSIIDLRRRTRKLVAIRQFQRECRRVGGEMYKIVLKLCVVLYYYVHKSRNITNGYKSQITQQLR